jgi:hypothetical protein|tara:strand:+ start:611 stop:1183 length:573 start_codon:yes stop_codon:yes gene_type:complete
MEQNEPSFNRAVPGSSLTAEPGGSAWKNPPQYASVDEAIDHYIQRLSTDEVADQVISVLDMGVPITSIANIMTMHGVMEGKHTIDVSMLIIPVLMELMALIGDSAGIEYNMGTEKDDPERVSDTTVQYAVEKMKTAKEDDLDDAVLNNFSDLKKEKEEPELGEQEEDLYEEEEVELEEESIPTGLMARRS